MCSSIYFIVSSSVKFFTRAFLFYLLYLENYSLYNIYCAFTVQQVAPLVSNVE